MISRQTPRHTPGMNPHKDILQGIWLQSPGVRKVRYLIPYWIGVCWLGWRCLLEEALLIFNIFFCNNCFSMFSLGNPYALELVNHEANLVRCIIWSVLCVEFFPDLFRDLFLHVYTRYYLVSFPSVSSHGCFISWMNILICMF